MLPLRDNPLPACAPPPAEFSLDERAWLLRLAHDSIAAALSRAHLEPVVPWPHLAVPRAAFTTLHLDARLRGCVGFVQALRPLHRTVAETAVAAAFQDPRFLPVSREEVSLLQVEISVLSPLAEIAPEAVVVGRHGLVVSQGFRRGLLLPQVAVEHGWDRLTLLRETCRKAGLEDDAWRHGAVVEAFTAEVFGDQDFSAPLV